MKDNSLCINGIKHFWKELDFEVDDKEKENSIMWRMLNCQYRMLVIRREISKEQFEEFVKKVTEYKRYIKRIA